MLCVGGNYGSGGVIVMVVEVVLCVGVGLLSLGICCDYVGLLLVWLFEVMIYVLEDGDVLLVLLDKVKVVVIGFGLG